MQFLPVGSGSGSRKIAVLHNSGATGNAGPGLFWLGGFKSDMAGSKAEAVADLGARLGAQTTRFDYSGHGKSGGTFVEGTISDWLEEAVEVFEQFTRGPQIVIGSSMGGWLAFLLNRALRAKGNNRVCALVTIAPAVDMTQDLMRAGFSDAELHELAETGRIERPSDYDEPYIVTKKLIEDGAGHLLFNAPLRTHCPVHILQGGMDRDVPPGHALKLASHLLLDPLTLTMVPDADHSLSRKQDLELLERTIIQAMEKGD